MSILGRYSMATKKIHLPTHYKAANTVRNHMKILDNSDRETHSPSHPDKLTARHRHSRLLYVCINRIYVFP